MPQTPDDFTQNGLSVVVPVHNGAATLPELVSRIGAVTDALGLRVEIILVNDGSRDASWATIQSLQQRVPSVRGINLSRNFGQHNALLCGIRAATRGTIVTIDDDLQHPPEAIPSLLEALEAGADVVYAPPKRQQHGLLRNIASRLVKLPLRNAMGAATARNVSAYRAFRTWVREAFTDYEGGFVSIDVLLTWGTASFASVPVEHAPRTTGKTNYTTRALMTHAFNMLTGFSALPLQVASVVGFAFTGLGLSLLAFVLIRWLVIGSIVPGFTFLASAISIFSGVQLFALGIIGEYLARMHFRTLGQPCYVVRED